MPKREDIKSIMIIGAGPIIIGQACEFDYSGTQACKALKEEGYKVILVNSNPATIMTDPETADVTYVEPITPAVVAKILEKEKPDALLPTMGGQTALNTALALAEDGTLDRLGIELIGANREAIAKAEDRMLFRQCMDELGLESPKSTTVKSYRESQDALEQVGLPAIIRPSFTLAGTGGGIAYNTQEFEEIVRAGLKASPVGEVLIEESVLGWKEFEMEVVRDKADNCIIICSIENVDPMGVHTGDSITVAPALTLTDKEYQYMRNASIAVLRGIGVETGGSNVQFAVNPEDGRVVVIEMNPRVSRSSALASKATGFPIAKVAAKLAVGYTLDELKNDITGTPASFEPTIDYIVTKIPRFTFEKFPGTEAKLTTSMKSVGEAMAIGRCFEESLQKALRSMETGLTGLNNQPLSTEPDQIRAALSQPAPDRILTIAHAYRHGFSTKTIHKLTKYDPWFLDRIEGIVEMENKILCHSRAGGNLIQKLKDPRLHGDDNILSNAKRLGFSDARIAELVGKTEADIGKLRRKAGITPVYKRVDTCAAEFPSLTSYMYSCYEGDGMNPAESEVEPSDKQKVVILGGGPNRIGQGIEFDYCCVHAAFALKEAGYETIMVNCNPETVSTDYDTSDRLYFEPLTFETVYDLIQAEQESGEVLGVIVQLGGQTPLKLAHDLQNAGIKILGTTTDAIDLAEDRERFSKLLKKLDLQHPPNGIARSEKEAIKIAEGLGFPLMIRPSYVLGGRAMEIVYDMADLKTYINTAVDVSGKTPVLIDRYLRSAIEVDIDALSDGVDVTIAGVMEHIEEAGVHSGDSACCLPPHSLDSRIVDDLKQQTVKLAKALNVVGLMNVQYAVQLSTDPENLESYETYILEVNPRASRTVPFVAKATGVPVAKIAARVMLGEKLDLKQQIPTHHTAVKGVVFPFARFPGVDVVLGPEMKSTGEVMGIDKDFRRAYAKAQLGADINLPTKGTVFISVIDAHKPRAIGIATRLQNMGFKIIATGGTARTLVDAGIKAHKINKVAEGQPHIVDAMINGDVDFMINTTLTAQSIRDSFSLRRTALMNKIPYHTTLSGAYAAVDSIEAMQQDQELGVKPLQEYLKAA